MYLLQIQAVDVQNSDPDGHFWIEPGRGFREPAEMTILLGGIGRRGRTPLCGGNYAKTVDELSGRGRETVDLEGGGIKIKMNFTSGERPFVARLN